MHKLIQTNSVTTEFYPKIHALNDGTFILVTSGPVTVQRFLMEPETEVPENEVSFFSMGIYGSCLVVLPEEGADTGEPLDVTPFLTSFGSDYGGNTWVMLDIPEPTELVPMWFGDTYWYPGTVEYLVKDISGLPDPGDLRPLPFENDGKLLIPTYNVSFDVGDGTPVVPQDILADNVSGGEIFYAGGTYGGGLVKFDDDSGPGGAM